MIISVREAPSRCDEAYTTSKAAVEILSNKNLTGLSRISAWGGMIGRLCELSTWGLTGLY